MSGRKKNKNRHRGQPPHELLNELNSLRELLGSDMEADIPLLDNIAEPAPSERSPGTRPPHTPNAAPRPLKEADLPILFSPVDEEPLEDFTPLLSDADRELLRPLQDLPRQTETMPRPETTAAETATTTDPELPAQADSEEITAEIVEEVIEEIATDEENKAFDQGISRKEFQPGLFDSPGKSAPTPIESTPQPTVQQKPEAPKKPATSQGRENQKPHSAVPKAIVQTSDNPFLPPHIRARLTGGRVPRPDPIPAASSIPAPIPAEPVQVEPAAVEAIDRDLEVEEVHVNAVSDIAASTPVTSGPKNEKERLIEQLVADQLPELERQLRANITALVEEIYSEYE
ncbi:hypothetical protein PVT68_04360 [Microbulbifer bruguierae]|uniref:Uncharacterized protein n=1 Tax=Microbulbifer bruguierae TaxID=3029061 RepID=A0ABY8NHI3_9GAMM|nr:hypothetical protein [Microbulbifer bruguierae]WGL17527.1 hypothetical protein PVT68_04360 [Microbulbifer bruguierae]